MSKVLVTESSLEAIGAAIRAKNGSGTQYSPSEMAPAIRAIPNYPEPSGSTQINFNGTYNVKNRASAVVNVPNTYSSGDEGKVVKNGNLASQSSKNIVTNGTHDTTENNQVVVNVPNSYGSSDEGKVVNNGALVSQSSRRIIGNGTYDTKLNKQVVVDVANAPTLKSKTITANGSYNPADDDADGYSAVNVNVPNSYAAGDEGKVVSQGVLVAQSSATKTVNGTFDTTLNNQVIVEIPLALGEVF